MKPNSAALFTLLTFVTSLLISMIFMVTSLYEVSIAGLKGFQLVLVGTSLEVSVLLFEIPTGIIADTVSRKLSVILGFFFIGLGFCIEGLFPLFIPILLAQVVVGLGFTFTSGATQAWLSDEIGETEANITIMKANKFDLSGSLVGLIFGIFIGSQVVSLPIIVGGVLLMLFSLSLFLLMTEKGFIPTAQENRNTLQHMIKILNDGVTVVRNHPYLLRILGVGLVFGLYSEGWDRLWVKYILDTFSLVSIFGIKEIYFFGILRAVSLAASIGFTTMAEKKIDVSSTKAISSALFMITSILAAGILLFSNSRSMTLVVSAFILVTISRNLIAPLYNAWINHKLESQTRATVLSISGQVDAIGQISSGPLAALISLISIPAALSFAGLLLTPALPLIQKVKTLSSKDF